MSTTKDIRDAIGKARSAAHELLDELQTRMVDYNQKYEEWEESGQDEGEPDEVDHSDEIEALENLIDGLDDAEGCLG
jgi:hypothetical protein